MIILVVKIFFVQFFCVFLPPPVRGPPQMTVNILEYSIPGIVMWESPHYYWALSGPEFSHAPSCGRRWALTRLQGNPRRSFCQQTWHERPASPRPRVGPVHKGTSLTKQGQRLSGCAVIMEEAIAEASSLPSHWSAQRAELCALIRALQLSKGKKTNIYTDSRYAFATLHVHGALYKERGLLTANRRILETRNLHSIRCCMGTWKGSSDALLGSPKGRHPTNRGKPTSR